MAEEVEFVEYFAWNFCVRKVNKSGKSTVHLALFIHKAVRSTALWDKFFMQLIMFNLVYGLDRFDQDLTYCPC